MKKHIFKIGVAVMLVVSFFAGSFFGNTDQAAAQDQDTMLNSISVQGTSSIITAPTMAYLTIGVETFNKDASIAQSQNATKMDAVYKSLQAIGITKANIKTVSYNINPRYDYKDDTSTLMGYDVSNLVEVTILDITKVSKALDASVKQGVNRSNSIRFGITDTEREALYAQALEKAVQNGKTKAQALAKAAGVTITKPSQIIENSNGFIQPFYTQTYERALGLGADVSTPISGGELKVEASVGIVYNY